MASRPAIARLAGVVRSRASVKETKLTSYRSKHPSPSSPGKRKRNAEGLVLSGISITHPDRVISETGHITKGELAEYYAAVAPSILPYVVRRPVSLLRCPSGIEKQCFFQRNPGKGLGAHVEAFEFRNKGKTYEYLYIEHEKGLLELVQMGANELHRGARQWMQSIIQIE